MKKINTNVLITVILIIAWAVAFPALNDYANSHRLLPGIGGEIMIPFGIVAAVMMWQTAADWKQTENEEDSTNER